MLRVHSGRVLMAYGKNTKNKTKKPTENVWDPRHEVVNMLLHGLVLAWYPQWNIDSIMLKCCEPHTVQEMPGSRNEVIISSVTHWYQCLAAFCPALKQLPMSASFFCSVFLFSPCISTVWRHCLWDYWLPNPWPLTDLAHSLHLTYSLWD